ncbi:MAG: Asp-tRNA(Asn)/Glu-tRNA(Gln) amidotransferase subunit GatB [Planctomycetes bacterium]|nr:Asp-tRNA(Asn)/Glu-tRNA(Gln) amidotransferase subunit GatB [Planctomycetota bacterium]
MPTPEVKVRTIVGLEIHVQLRTRTKLFCACPVRYDAPPNTCICPVCLGHPGALPVINRRAFDYALLTGLALNCRIAGHTRWDRKNYFYPDLPKNYQISQYDLPLATEGSFEIPFKGGSKHVRIQRVHLEEDAGKSIHDTPGCTLIDLNRAGTPLLEIVTEPDLVSADETYTFCVELQRLVTHLGVSEGVMQLGQMRFEPNVNLVIEFDGAEFRTPIAEIKNLNSFRHVRDAIEYESKRQLASWHDDHEYRLDIKANENRGWNADRGITEFQRGKEAAHDYRYFPDPDLAPIDVTEKMIEDVRVFLPELPVARRRRFVDEFSLAVEDAETIVNHRPTADLFEQVIAAGGPADIVGKQFVNVWQKLAKDRNVKVTDLGVDSQCMAELAKITADGTINKSAANQLAKVLVTRSDPPASDRVSDPLQRESLSHPEPQASACANPPAPAPLQLAQELGLVQVQDTAATEAWVDQVFAENPKAVQDACTNPKKVKAAAGFLRGQVMKLSGGKADPKIVGERIGQRLAKLTQQK